MKSSKHAGCPQIDQRRLREALHYDTESGLFTWKISPARNVKKGRSAGTLTGNGYVKISIDKAAYMAHRLAWLYVNGVWPNDQIDHINGIKNDNKISNLRDVSAARNIQNQSRAHRSNKGSGLLGAHSAGKGKWRARILVGGKRINIGTFATPVEAHAAYLEAKKDLHEGYIG